MSRLLQLILLSCLLYGCGPGLCVGDGSGGCELTPAGFVLTGFENLTIRKNDCYPITLSAVDAAGNTMAQVNASVNLTASTGVVLYSSLEGCQTYDSLYERSTYFLTTESPQVVFYFRSDVEGAVSISAATSSGVGTSVKPVTVQYIPFDQVFGPSERVNCLIESASGSTYVGGNFTLYDDLQVGAVARVLENGLLDTTFRPTGEGIQGQVLSMVQQGDGKVVVGGLLTSYDGTTLQDIARLNSDGSLDSTFGLTGAGLDSYVNSIGLQTDGKLVIAGNFTTYDGTSRRYLTRLNTDGSLDTSFTQTGTGLGSQANEVWIQSDGKIVVVGDFTAYNGTARVRVARFNTDGTLDGTFVPTGGFNGSTSAVAVQTDGKIVVGGSFSTFNGTSRPFIARLNSGGSLDTTFAAVGAGVNAQIRSLAVQSDNAVLIAGDFTDYGGSPRPYLMRLASNGDVDTTFSLSGSGLSAAAFGVLLRSDGKVTVGGDFMAYNGQARNHLAQFHSDGSLDSVLAPPGKNVNGTVNVTLPVAGGKALVGGIFTAHGGTARSYIARVTADGDLDTSFAPTGTGLSGGQVYTIATQSDGAVIVGGSFTTYNGTSRPYIARLNADGSLDTNFATTGTGFGPNVRSVAVQTDGKIVVGGWFSTYNGTSTPYLARLNGNGSLDTTFNQGGSGLNTIVSVVALQSDGKILVTGSFATYNGTAASRFIRLNSDGSRDLSFTLTGTGITGGPDALALQPDGKILAGGSFTTYNGASQVRMMRVNSDGSLDPTFAVGSGFQNQVISLALQANGKVVVGGRFTSYNGTARGGIARLNSDGSLDTTFMSGVGFVSSTSATVNSVAIQSDRKVLVGGQFSGFNTSAAAFFARLTYLGELD